MKITKYKNKEAWLAGRNGKITGSKLKDVVSTTGKKKIGFWELVAERIATEPDEEKPMDRGNRLEPLALERYEKETKEKVNKELVIWERDDNSSIAVSPDGFVGKKKAIECKCLSSARHIEAWVTKKVPDEYWYQTLQYFIVNEDLSVLDVVFYDPRVTVKDYFVITLNRKDLKDDIKMYLDYETITIAEVNKIVNSLTF